MVNDDDMRHHEHSPSPPPPLFLACPIVPRLLSHILTTPNLALCTKTWGRCTPLGGAVLTAWGMARAESVRVGRSLRG